MKILDKFIADYVAMLCNHGVIKDPQFWSKFLVLVAMSHYFFALFIFILLRFFPHEDQLYFLFAIFFFLGSGFIWHRTSMKFASR